MKKPIYSVNEINKYIKTTLTNDESLQYILVKGEISNFKPAATGHLYFSLKDEDSLINCVMFSSFASKNKFNPANGDEVVVLASVDVYVPRGSYQLYIYEMYLNGVGSQYEELEKLKKKLADEGLFDPARKRTINQYPVNIGIITAKKSAAIKDLSFNIHRRYPMANIYFFPASVQGENAPKELLAAFKRSQEYYLDTLIIGRGGGASEDLSAFNDEALVRALATSKMPTISAVGHEIDSTLVDFVCDKRASTPTAAAELATVDIRELYQSVDTAVNEMQANINHQVERMHEELEHNMKELNDSMMDIINNGMQANNSLAKQLEALNPSSVLSRGYSITINTEGKVVNSTSKVKIGDVLVTMVEDGQITSEVTRKETWKKE